MLTTPAIVFAPKTTEGIPFVISTLSNSFVGKRLKSILLSQGILRGTPSKNKVNCLLPEPRK